MLLNIGQRCIAEEILKGVHTHLDAELALEGVDGDVLPVQAHHGEQLQLRAVVLEDVPVGRSKEREEMVRRYFFSEGKSHSKPVKTD